MIVAAIQLNSQGDVLANLASAEEQVLGAARAGATLVVLPEGFSFLGSEVEKVRVAAPLTPGTIVHDRLAAWSRQSRIFIVAGGLPELSSDGARPFNTSAVFDPSGTVVFKYRKMHLFDVDLSDGIKWHESAATSAGDAPIVTDIAGHKVGLAICYDVRFPEVFAWQRQRGAELLTLPAAFTFATGAAHWHVLLRARAIETQCWLVAAAQEGSHPGGRRTFGHSLIVDPWGEVVAERTSAGPGFVVAEVDWERMLKIRRQMPISDHRRLV